MNWTGSTALVVCSLIGSFGSSGFAAGPDWPYWIGPYSTGVSLERDLPETWTPQGGENSNVLWSVENGTRSTPILMNQRIYLRSGGGWNDGLPAAEQVICLDATNGNLHWKKELPVSALQLLNGPADQPLVESSLTGDPETGHVYLIGNSGQFSCLDGQSGERIWERSLNEEFGFLMVGRHQPVAPLIHEGNVIVGGDAAGWGQAAETRFRFVALDKKNGLATWLAETQLQPQGSSRGAPVLGVIQEELQLIAGSSDGTVYSLQPRTGKRLWSFTLTPEAVISTPLIHQDQVIVSYASSESTGAVVCLDATQRGDSTRSATHWKVTDLPVSLSAPILFEQRLYVVDDRGQLRCLDVENGEPIGAPVDLGSSPGGNLLAVDRRLVIHTTDGQGILLKPTEQGAEVLHRYRFADNESCHSAPIAWNGRLYAATTGRLYCIGKTDHHTEAATPEPLPRERHVALDEVPVTLNVVPAEISLATGTRQKLGSRLYNSRGQYLNNARPEDLSYALLGAGLMDEAGRYTILPSQVEPVGVLITARWKSIEGLTRIRVIPESRLTCNFSDGKIPPTWIGQRDDSVIADWDLYSTLQAADPLAGSLYLSLLSEFQRVGPLRELDDSAPNQSWTRLCSHLPLPEDVSLTTVEECQTQLDASLQTLKRHGVLENFSWSTWNRTTDENTAGTPEPRLSLQQGERSVKDGNGVLCLRWTSASDSHPVTWIGTALAAGETFQMNFRSPVKSGGSSCAGVISNGTLIVVGGAPSQISLYTGNPSQSETTPWESAAGTWYTLKMTCEQNEGKRHLRGKVWPRDGVEPEDWAVAVEEPSEPVSGSLGILTHSAGDDIFYDDITIR